MKLSLITTVFVILVGCTPSHQDNFYCDRDSSICYTKPQGPAANYMLRPNAYCFTGYVDTNEQVRFQPFKICYPTFRECRMGNYDHSWVAGTKSPCDLNVPSQGGSGFDLKENKQQGHL
jgi:hypothetical protein